MNLYQFYFIETVPIGVEHRFAEIMSKSSKLNKRREAFSIFSQRLNELRMP
jgi:hypothetical protein